MKIITSIIKFLLVLLVGTQKNEKARLQKQQEESMLTSLFEKIEAFLMRHASFFLAISLIVLMALFIFLCYAICGISATESGTLYNHWEEII